MFARSAHWDYNCQDCRQPTFPATRHKGHVKIHACFKHNPEVSLAQATVGWKNKSFVKCWPAAESWQAFFANTFLFHNLARNPLGPKPMIGTTWTSSYGLWNGNTQASIWTSTFALALSCFASSHVFFRRQPFPSHTSSSTLLLLFTDSVCRCVAPLFPFAVLPFT